MPDGAALGVFFVFGFDTAVIAVGDAAAVETLIAPFAAAFRLVVARPVFQSVAFHINRKLLFRSGLPLSCACAGLSTIGGTTTTSGGGVGGLLSNCPLPLQNVQPQFTLLCSLSAASHMRCGRNSCGLL